MRKRDVGEIVTGEEPNMIEEIPRLNQCYLCKTWQLEKDLHPIEIPDQDGYVRKLACQKCLKEITGIDSGQSD